MKTIVLIFAALFTFNATNAQFSQNFEGTENSLTSNCWDLSGVFITNDPADVITGNGSLYTNPPSSTREMISPALNITSTSFTVTFNYKVSSKISGNATRTIEVGIMNPSGTFTSLALITMDNNSPTTVQNFNQTFTLGSTGLRKLVLRLGGNSGDGNSRLIVDDITSSAPARYGTGTCNSAPVAVNDVFNGVIGGVLTGNILTNDSDPDNETFTPTIVNSSNNGIVVLNPDGGFTFTPNLNFNGSSTSFTYRLTDNGFSPLESNIATVTLNFFTPIVTPVKLISFDAKYNKPDVTLNWSTAQEKNFSHFVVEQSVDGINFSELAVVVGAGESDSRLNYSYIDKNLAGRKGLVYYRLESVDIDHKVTYSSVRIIRLDENGQKISVTTYPNPVSNELRVTISSNWQNKKVVYEIINTNGQVSLSKQIANSSQTETINTGNLVPGFYIARVTCDGVTTQQKIVKQ